MIVRDYICKECKYICNAIHFQHNFKNWTSGNDDIDKFIQYTQLSVHRRWEVLAIALEWIPYDRFYDIEYIAKGGFGIVYRATWIDGRIQGWDYERQNWKRDKPNLTVDLKSLNNSKNVTLEFIKEV